MEVFQESDGVTTGPLGTLPFTLPSGCLFVVIAPFEVVKTPRPVTSAVADRVSRLVHLPCP